jgi:hypothetical protein
LRFFSIFLYQKFGDCHHKSSKFNQIYTREKKMSFLLSRAYPFVISMGTIQSPMLSFLLGGGGREISLHFHPMWEAASIDEWSYNGGGPYKLSVLP